MESSYSSGSAVPMEADDAIAQFLGLGAEAHGGHGSHGCFAYEQQDESMEAMAAMLFMPGLDTDSNSSSSCLNYDAPPHPQCWPQPQPGHAHSSSVTSFLGPAAHGFEGFEFPDMEMHDPFQHAHFEPHCATIPFLGEEFRGNHSSGAAGGDEAANDHAPVNNKRKSSSAAMPASKKAKKTGKKGFSGIENDEGGDAYIVDPQSSSSCTSEDGDVDGNAKSSSKKTGTRASRGAATDPQSLYARKRRERINERLKILQNLVPNGTKVDISTMLEEAVEYVKFMQLQIKL